MSTVAEVHVGDIGTTYTDHILDADAEFDPTSATTIKMIFACQNGAVLERTATVSTTGSGPTQKWFLNYVVLSADIAAGLHKTTGRYRRQGFVRFPDGTEYHTSIIGFVVGGNLN